MIKPKTRSNSTLDRRSILTSVVTGPALILMFALAGLAVEMQFLSNHHDLLKRQQELAHSAAQLNISLKKQSQAWLDYLLYRQQDGSLWKHFRERERATLAQANQLLIQVDRDQLQSDVRAIIYALEVLRITYQERRVELLRTPSSIDRYSSNLHSIDQVPSQLIEQTYQEIQQHANHTSISLRQRALVMTSLFALVLVVTTLLYSRWSTRHTQNLLDRQETSQKKVQWLLTHDYLTGLFTRAQLIVETEERIRDQKHLYAFHFNLSNAKSAAQTQGHSVHDQLIQIAAQRLMTEKRSQDILARSIGEEFILIVEDDDSLRLRRYAKNLLSKIGDDFSVSGFRHQISCSLGISHYPQHADSCKELLRCADIAAVHAHRREIFEPCLYSPAMSDRITDKFALIENLKSALENDRLEVQYQPKVDLLTRAIIGVEVLARLNTDNPVLNSPDTFIPLAEETGLIHTLGKQVSRKALSQLEQWQHQGYKLSLAINVSAKQLEAPDFSTFLVDLCQKHSIDPTRVDVELTESSYIKNNHPQLNKLREAKFRISIDDFGTGYSNLGYLSHFAPHQLKIDRSFIDGMTRSDSQNALVESIVGLAKNQKIEIVAEGIETEIQAHLLKRMGVEVGQGYLFSKPIDANLIEPLLIQSSQQSRQQVT
ncbi:MAG: putative bifunctional diguanylate cyclase/phosphodiesterase [Cellvibrionaceae bacterium]